MNRVRVTVRHPFVFDGIRRRRGEVLLVSPSAARHLVEAKKAWAPSVISKSEGGGVAVERESLAMRRYLCRVVRVKGALQR